MPLFCFFLNLNCLFLLYNALKEAKSTKFFGFLFIYGICTLVHLELLISLGDTMSGSIGILLLLDSFGTDASFLTIFSLIYVITEGLCTFGYCWTWYSAFKYYRVEGLDKNLAAETRQAAVNLAAQHKDVLIQAAKDNPELVKDLVASSQE